MDRKNPAESATTARNALKLDAYRDCLIGDVSFLVPVTARHSSSVSTARRRCGITIDPPTTRPNVEGFEEFGIRHPYISALDDVVSYAVVASEDH